MILIEFLAAFIFINVMPGLALAFYLTRKKESAGLFDKLILAAIASPLVVVLVSFVEEAAGVPQGAATLAVNLAVLAVANIALLARFFPGKESLRLRLSWVKLACYALFAALVFFRVWPAHGLLAPVLHDPIAQTEWLKLLTTTHFTTTEQWYPQGLVLYLNYYAALLPVSDPQVVLYSAGAILAFFPISLFYLGLLTFEGKDRWLLFPLIVFVIAARVAYPNELYLTAGKNSMILAFAIAPLLFYLIASLESRWDYMLAAALIFAVIVIHYPTGFFLLFTALFINLGRLVAARGWKRPSLDMRVLSYYGSAAAVTLGLGAILLYKVLPIYHSHPVSEDGSFSLTIEAVRQNGVIQFVYRNFLTDQLTAYHTTPIILLAASLSAFLLVGAGNKRFTARLLASSTALYLLGAALLFAGGTSLGVNYNIEIRFFLVFLIVIMLGWFVYYVLDRIATRIGHEAIVRGGLVVVLGVLFLNTGVGQERLYRSTAIANETVSQADLAAFAFIDSSLPDGRMILVQLGSPLPNHGIIAGADSGAWIPSFTGRQVEVDFLQFTGPRSSSIYDLYLALAANGKDAAAIRGLYCDYDVGYVFFGSRAVFFNNMQPGTLDKSSYFERIYDGDARLYQIKPLSCDARA